MIETEYLYQGINNRIIYNENRDCWVCDELGLEDENLTNLKIKIEKRIEANKKQEKQKIYSIECMKEGYNNDYKEIKVTSIVTGYQYNKSGLAVWAKIGQRREKIDINDVYRKNNVIMELLKEKEEIEKKIFEWKQNNRYYPKDLIRDMGYTNEYSKNVFCIDLEEGTQDE